LFACFRRHRVGCHVCPSHGE